MGKTMFYRCMGCGNFVTFIGEKTACTPKCCGEPMTELIPGSTDAAQEKHVPAVSVSGHEVTAEVGSVAHPMTEAHRIEWIYLETERGGQIHYMQAGEEPKVSFLAAEGDAPVSVYAYCNLHGLWEKSLAAEEDKKDSKTLIAYFTTGEATKLVAETIASVHGGKVFEITPKAPYTEDDLDWTDRSSRSNQEMHDETARPELTARPEGADQYDTIFVGFPIWWGLAPKPVYSFLDSIDLTGKTIVPFCTSGGSKAAMVDKDFGKNVKGAGRILPASLLNGKPGKEEVAAWIKSLDL